jgi:hypothetical protein
MNETILEDQEGRVAYGLAELGAKMNLSHRTIVNLVRTGALASIHVGKRVLIPAQAARDFIAERYDTTGSTTKEPPPHIKKKQDRARLAGKK